MNIKTENWCGHIIRFVEIDGEWWGILRDICSALDLETGKVSQRLDADMMKRVPIEKEIEAAQKYDVLPKHNVEKTTKRFRMLAVNEIGIYETLFASRKLEARNFRKWSATVMQKLRKQVGLEQYEVMRMTESEIQEDIDHILDTLFYDEETEKLMQSVTIQGGDVEQVPFE